jgi:alpha-1,6-mannosyltransferase
VLSDRPKANGEANALLATMAFAYLLPHPQFKVIAPRIRVAVSLLVFAGVIVRGELAILLATISVYLLLVPLASLQQLIRTGTTAFLAALLLSVPIDSYFWQRPMWPELAGFYYNAVQGKSSDWGVSPWHYYFTSALPRLLHPVAFVWGLWHPPYTRFSRTRRRGSLSTSSHH